MIDSKLSWQGTIIAVQPRIRLTRSFDQRYHNYLGYTLRLQGEIDGQEGEFLAGIGKAAQAKHQFRVGDMVSGRSAPVTNPAIFAYPPKIPNLSRREPKVGMPAGQSTHPNRLMSEFW